METLFARHFTEAMQGVTVFVALTSQTVGVGVFLDVEQIAFFETEHEEQSVHHAKQFVCVVLGRKRSAGKKFAQL